MSLLDSKNKFNNDNKAGSSALKDSAQDQFFKWTGNNFYRTSYNDMRSSVPYKYIQRLFQSPVERKNFAIPGYKGFIPGQKNGNSNVGSRFAESTRQSLTRERIDDREQLVSSTGFNWKRMSKVDESLHAVCPKYGKSTIMAADPSWKPDTMRSTAQNSFRPPSQNPSAVWRAREPMLKFDNGVKAFESPTKPDRSKRMNSSGFTMNTMLFDGTTWQTEKNLHTDQIRTSYRNMFNTEKPFHKASLRENPAVLKRKVLVYDQ